MAMPWDDLIQSLMERRADALSTSMQTAPERREIVDFTNFYYESIHALIGPASSAAIPNIADPNSLKGKKIGVQTATVSAAYGPSILLASLR
ncbi:MAG TPA: transporter substrate-binding domain-containing protein [Dongiaceae bacterium]|nr:transporter substrate-binding domain-containing protein [Dongiaceae bacterium]